MVDSDPHDAAKRERRALPLLTSRRDFVRDAARGVVAGAVTGMARPFLGPCARTAAARTSTAGGATALPPTTVDVHTLTRDGQALVAPFKGPDGAPILIVRQSAHDYLALSLQCTHEGCPVNAPVHGVMTCPCHGSQFDLAGNVRHGPAQYPLGRYDSTYDAASHRVTLKYPE